MRSSTSFQRNNQAGLKHGASPDRNSADDPQELGRRADELCAGLEPVSSRQRALAMDAARLEVHIARVDAWMASTSGIVDHRGRQKGCASLYLDLHRYVRETLAALEGRSTRAQRDGRKAAGALDADQAHRELQRLYGPKPS